MEKKISKSNYIRKSKFILRFVVCFKLGFNFFVANNRDKDYYIKNYSKWYKVKGIIYLDDKKLEDILLEKINYNNINSFDSVFKNLFVFVGKSNVFNLFRLLGIFCVVIGISSLELASPYSGITTFIGCSYVVYNFLYSLTNLIV